MADTYIPSSSSHTAMAVHGGSNDAATSAVNTNQPPNIQNSLAPFQKNQRHLSLEPRFKAAMPEGHIPTSSEHTIAVHSASNDTGTSAVNTFQISSPPNIQNPLFPFKHYQELPEFVTNYFADIDNVRYRLPNLEEPEVFDSENIMDFLNSVMQELERVRNGQQHMQKKHHDHGNSLDAKLHSMRRRRIFVAAFFLILAAFMSGAAATVAVAAGKMKHIAAMVAAAGVFTTVAYLIMGAAKWMDSYPKERESSLEKHKGVSDAMIEGDITANVHLMGIQSALKIANDGAGETGVRNKMEALKLKINRYNSGVSKTQIRVAQLARHFD